MSWGPRRVPGDTEIEAQVREFMERKLGWELPDKLAIPPVEKRLQRVRQIVEESAELVEAIHDQDIVKIADGIGDAIYVLVGTALAHGIPIKPVLDEIHRSNMTKDELNEQGKGGKGEGYEPPRLKEVLTDAQGR